MGRATSLRMKPIVFAPGVVGLLLGLWVRLRPFMFANPTASKALGMPSMGPPPSRPSVRAQPAEMLVENEGGLEHQALWLHEMTATPKIKWLSASVLSVDIADEPLMHQLGQLCLSLEKNGSGRLMSNVGGFQSHPLAVDTHPALSALLSFTHKPLSAFLHRRWRGVPPPGVRDAKDLTLASSPEHIWANVNRPGHHNRLHEHGPPLLSRAASCIYYPFVEDPGGQSDLNRPAPVRFYDGGRMVEVHPRPGLLLLFPTDLPHEVDPFFFGPPRVSIALNLFVRWLDSPLLRAARAGDVLAVSQLVQDGVDLEQADGVLNFRAAHLAAEAGHISVVEALTALGGEDSSVSLEGWSPLGLAAAQGHIPVVQHLTRHAGSKINMSGSTQPPSLYQELDLTKGFASFDDALAVAAERGHRPIVDLLSISGSAA